MFKFEIVILERFAAGEDFVGLGKRLRVVAEAGFNTVPEGFNVRFAQRSSFLNTEGPQICHLATESLINK